MGEIPGGDFGRRFRVEQTQLDPGAAPPIDFALRHRLNAQRQGAAGDADHPTRRPGMTHHIGDMDGHDLHGAALDGGQQRKLGEHAAVE